MKFSKMFRLILILTILRYMVQNVAKFDFHGIMKKRKSYKNFLIEYESEKIHWYENFIRVRQIKCCGTKKKKPRILSKP